MVWLRQDFELRILILILEVIAAMTGALPRPYIPVTQLLTAVMQIAAEHHRAGRSAAARAMYEEVLKVDTHVNGVQPGAGPTVTRAIYQLQFALTKAELDRTWLL